MEHDTAGDPMGGLLWTRRTTAKLAGALSELDIAVCDRTAARLLLDNGYKLRVNHKKLAGASHPDRDAQFDIIAGLRAASAAEEVPVISVDSKKKELVGRFKNPGARWGLSPELVNDHDFRSDALGIATPYGIYDIHDNSGAVFVGKSNDTPQFAVEAIAKWWETCGRERYPQARKLLILADAGGSNGCRPRAWKYFLQRLVANPFGLTVTVAHYPAGASKWNPIEHRMFSEVSKNWAGVPLETFDTLLKYLRSTTTTTGLRIEASMVDKTYRKGLKISPDQMSQLNIASDPNIPQWNYTIKPQIPDLVGSAGLMV